MNVGSLANLKAEPLVKPGVKSVIVLLTAGDADVAATFEVTGVGVGVGVGVGITIGILIPVPAVVLVLGAGVGVGVVPVLGAGVVVPVPGTTISV